MPNDLQKVRAHHRTHPHHPACSRSINRLPRVQLVDGSPGRPLFFRHLRHRTHQRKNRYLQDIF